jgi:hypothetical protein
MPRSFNEYSRRDWMRIRPVLERYKMARYSARVAWYVRRRALVGNPAAVARGIRDRRVLITVAFDDPQLVRWQTDLVRLHVRDCVHLIIDNSSDDQVARQIEAEAHARELFYLRLAPNPWRGPDSGRAHGLAMSWTWRHVVKPGAPEAFGFIDHDLFPTEETDPFAPLQAVPVCGRLVDGAGRRWNLWAGFCFFRFDAVARSRLDFRLDWSAGVDTGGCNWQRLYRHIDRGRIPAVAVRREAALPDRPIEDCYFEWVGSWLHEKRFNQLFEHRPQKREVLARRLASLMTGIKSRSLQPERS